MTPQATVADTSLNPDAIIQFRMAQILPTVEGTFSMEIYNFHQPQADSGDESSTPQEPASSPPLQDQTTSSPMLFEEIATGLSPALSPATPGPAV